MVAIQTISRAEQQSRALQRAMSIAEFCARYGVGLTTAYAEINEGRLRARKCHRRTLIAQADAEAWLQRLPVVGASR
jgi:excisionase family DNA binding protein